MPENSLLQHSAKMVRDAGLEAAKDLTKDSVKDLTTLLTTVMPSVAATMLSAFSIQLVLVFLKALADDDKSQAVLRHLDKLVALPLNTAFSQLQIALALEVNRSTENQEQCQHRVSRYRDGLRSFDQALAVAKDDETPAIHLYRALVATRIPGADREASFHFSQFSKACEQLSVALSRKSREEDAVANQKEASAAKITVIPGGGLGGGLVGMSIAEDRLKKKQLEYEAKSHRDSANALLAQARELSESVALISSLLFSDQARSADNSI